MWQGYDKQGCIEPLGEPPRPVTDEPLLIGPNEKHEVRYNKNTHEWRYDKATESESEVTIIISPRE